MWLRYKTCTMRCVKVNLKEFELKTTNKKPDIHILGTLSIFEEINGLQVRLMVRKTRNVSLYEVCFYTME